MSLECGNKFFSVAVVEVSFGFDFFLRSLTKLRKQCVFNSKEVDYFWNLVNNFFLGSYVTAFFSKKKMLKSVKFYETIVISIVIRWEK